MSTVTKMNEVILKIQDALPHLRTLLQSRTTHNISGVILAYTLLRTFNRVLSSFVLNNWTSDKYDWSREIVLVTGGCSGIGQGITNDLASRGIKVIVVDIQEPSSLLRMFFSLSCSLALSLPPPLPFTPFRL